MSAAFTRKVVENPDGTRTCLQLWDTAGQEQYDAITPTYYRSANAVALVCAVDQPDSLMKAQYWLGQIRRYADARVRVYLLVNKTDLTGELPRRALDDFAQLNGLRVFEMSAKTGAGVASFVAEALQDCEPAERGPMAPLVDIVRDPPVARKRGCCQ